MPHVRAVLAVPAAAVLTAGLVVAVTGQSPAVAATTPTSCADKDRFFDVNHPPANTPEVGYDDIALGSPMKDRSGHKDAGTVTIVYGDADGTFGSNDGRRVTMDSLGFTIQDGDRFGAAVLVADLNGDQCGDLVVGVPGRNKGAGVVVIAYGAPRGSTPFSVTQVLKQGSGGVPGTSEAGDGFGSSLAVTGLNAQGGPTRLWVGSPGEDIGSVKDAGQVTVFPTTADGATAVIPMKGITTRQQGKGGVSSKAEAGDKFGFALSGSHTSMLVGSPGEDVGKVKDAGMFHAFISGKATGYTAGSGGVPGASEPGDQLGRSLAIGPSCLPGKQTWLIGAPLENVGTRTDAGQVLLMDRGTKTGLALNQGAKGIDGTAESGDRFGSSLNATGTVNRSAAVFAVGTPTENIGATVDAGNFTTFSTTCPGNALTVTDVKTWQRGNDGIGGSPTKNDLLGQSLGAALVDVDPDQEYRLLVGLPGGTEATEDGPLIHAGLVLIMDATSSGFTGTGSTLLGQGPMADTIPGIGKPGDAFGSGLDSASANR